MNNTLNINYDLATEKQVAYIKALLDQRVAPLALRQQAEAELLSKVDASQVIEALLACSRKVGSGRAENSQVVANTAPTREVPVGIYTVTDGEHGWVTLQVTKPKWADGQTVVAYLNGTDNEWNYKKFAFITRQGLKVWRSASPSPKVVAASQFLFTGNLDEARAEFLNVAEALAMASGKCSACGRTLTVPASLHRGLGPECAKRY